MDAPLRSRRPRPAALGDDESPLQPPPQSPPPPPPPPHVTAQSLATLLHNAEFSEAPPTSLTASDAARALARWLCGCDVRHAGVLGWARRVTRATVLADAVASATVTVVLIPQSMAYAVIAGLPPVVGLYTGTICCIVYGLLTSSSQVSVGSVAPTAILMATTIAAATGFVPGTPDFLTAHLTLAFLSGCFQIACGVLRLGFIARLLSWPVMSGFSAGAGVIIISSQACDLLGLSGFAKDYNNTLNQIAVSFGALPSISWPTAAIGIPSLLLLLFWRDLRWRGKPALPRQTPMGLLLILLLVLVSWAADLSAHGIKTVGPLPAGLPPPAWPVPSAALAVQLLPAAAIIGSINFIQTVALATIFGKKVKEEVVPNGEFFALGAASLAGSFFSCHTVVGSFTRTAVQYEAGSKTPLTGILTGCVLLALLYSILRIFAFLPTVILAAATDNEFPAWLAQKEGRLAEEHRLFYVGASRARRRLIFTWHRQNAFGRLQEPSRFLRHLPGFPK